MASRAASRAVCRRGDRRVGRVGDGKELSWQRVGRLSSSVIVGPVGLRVHDGDVFEPQAGAGDLRFGSVPLHRRERSSRPRHHRNVSASLSQGHRSAVRAGAGVGARDGPAQDGHGGTGRHENPRQCQPAQRASYEHAGKIEAQLKAEVAELLARAEAADQAGVADGMSIPEELARREERLAKLAEARAKLEARAKERFEREMAEHRAKLAARDEKTATSGKKPGGRTPAPPIEGPQPKDQINLTDEESRIMPVAGGGYEQCYNAQAMVAAESLLVIAVDVVQAPNDKQQIAPMLEKVDALPEQLGRPETLLADNGYFSEANVMACTAANIEPLIATGRQPHHPSWRERFAAPPPAPENPTPVEAMAWRLRTPQGKQLYGLRKQTPEPVFGIIKSVMGFRQFLLRGLDCVRGEWSLVTMAWNIKRMHALSLG